MDVVVQSSFANLLAMRAVDPRTLVEYAIEYVAELAVLENAESGVVVDPDDVYDAIIEGIRSSAERRIIDGTCTEV